MPTKRELIDNHKRGQLVPIASYPLSNNGGIAICYMDDYSEKVFGFMAYGQDAVQSKDYFYVKINNAGRDSANFKVGQLTIPLSGCMRI